jgi:RHS repeat-associated protein
MQMPGRDTIFKSSYRYGFNGKEMDNETYGGQGNEYDYGMRIYNPRIGRFLSADPISKSYPMLTPYQFASNRPIDGVDVDGLEYASYRLTVDYISGKVISSELIWHNPNQHNEYGSEGPGILYEISVWDSWFKEYKSYNVQTMVKRNASTAFGLISKEYGNYMGATSLYKIDNKGNFTKQYDYSVPPVDAVDNFAQQHDKGYDALGAVGANGLFDDWGTTPIDELALAGWNKFMASYKVGDVDPFNGQKVTASESNAAWKGSNLFSFVVQQKKIAISAWMSDNFKEAKKGKAGTTGVPSQQDIDFNYNLFLQTYMEKDKNGNWQRKSDMWTQDDKGNWSPKKPKT